MKIAWFARAGEIERTGPFDTQIKAFEAMRLVRRPDDAHWRYPPDLLVWPEEVPEPRSWRSQCPDCAQWRCMCVPE